MKRRVLCVFLLILYLLVVCTMLSAKIAEEMSTLVKVEKRTSSRQTGRSMTINIRAVYTDPEGDHLYEVRDGEGWNTGLRTYDVSGFGINMVDGVATLYGPRDYVFVRAASRQPRDGELAIVVEEFETGKDTYLYYYKHGIPEEWDLPPYLKVIAQSENSLLTENTEGTFPFLPHLAKTWTITTDMADRVFSLSEVCQFLRELPKATLAFTLLGMGLLLLLISFLLLDDRKLLYGNIATIGTMTGLFGLVLSKIDLPASLLPSSNILDLEYYKNEMILIVEELECMAEQSYSIPELMNDIQQQCACILYIGLLFVGVIVIFEVIILWKKSNWEVIMKIRQYFRKVKFYDKILWGKYLAVLGVVSSIVTLISFFITAQDFGVCSVYLLIIFCAAVIGIFLYMWWAANQVKHADLRINNTKVCVAEGDIWALMKKEPSDRTGEVSVIAVNDYYDIIVDDRIVAAKSLHGQYVNKLIKEKKLDALNAVIENDNVLNEPNNCEKVPQRAKGRQMRYAIGSVVEFESYVLAAFTKFDEHNKAFLSAEEYTSFWMHFWENIDGIYAGRTINIPLIGAGITRFRNGKPSKQELLEIMLWTLKISGFHNTYADRQINIIIYPPDANEIDFYHIQHNRNYH